MPLQRRLAGDMSIWIRRRSGGLADGTGDLELPHPKRLRLFWPATPIWRGPPSSQVQKQVPCTCRPWRRGRGRAPRGPRGHATGRAGSHFQVDRYTFGQSRGRSRSRTPPRRMRSPTTSRALDHWSPPPQGRRSPRPRIDSYPTNPHLNSYIPPVEHGGPWQLNRSYRPASPGAPVPRYDTKHPFVYRRQNDMLMPRTSPSAMSPRMSQLRFVHRRPRTVMMILCLQRIEA